MSAWVFLFLGLAANAVVLKDSPGKEKVTAHCQTCHSLEYVEMNAHFLGEKGWSAEVAKMIKTYGAPIPQEDVAALVKYLSLNY